MPRSEKGKTKPQQTSPSPAANRRSRATVQPERLPARDGHRAEAGEVVMVRRSAIAPRVTCSLCGGILRDATTVSECLHSFCRKCIYQKFKDDDIKCCPTCYTDLGCAPLEKLRADRGLQHIRSAMFPTKKRKVDEISPLDPGMVHTCGVTYMRQTNSTFIPPTPPRPGPSSTSERTVAALVSIPSRETQDKEVEVEVVKENSTSQGHDFSTLREAVAPDQTDPRQSQVTTVTPVPEQISVKVRTNSASSVPPATTVVATSELAHSQTQFQCDESLRSGLFNNFNQAKRRSAAEVTVEVVPEKQKGLMAQLKRLRQASSASLPPVPLRPKFRPVKRSRPSVAEDDPAPALVASSGVEAAQPELEPVNVSDPPLVDPVEEGRTAPVAEEATDPSADEEAHVDPAASGAANPVADEEVEEINLHEDIQEYEADIVALQANTMGLLTTAQRLINRAIRSPKVLCKAKESLQEVACLRDELQKASEEHGQVLAEKEQEVANLQAQNLELRGDYQRLADDADKREKKLRQELNECQAAARQLQDQHEIAIRRLKLELDDLKTTTTYLMDIVAPVLESTGPVPIHTQLKEAPGQVKALLKETAMVCTKHVLALLKSHYPQLALERVGEGRGAGCNKARFEGLVEEVGPVAKSVLSALIVRGKHLF